jgi:LEA14-like dessication related protein
MFRATSLLAAVAFCAFATGCASLNVQKPTAAVTGMALQGVDANGFTLNFALDVHNPNSFTLPLGAADYQLGVGGVNVLDGKASPSGSVPAGASVAVSLPVTVAFENLLKAEQSIRDTGGNVPYDFAGGLSFNTGSPLLGTVRVPLRSSGTLPLKQILSDPEALLRNPAAKRLAASVLGHFFGQ